MAFWAGILVGAGFVWLALQMGFYETWTMLFNIVVSVYVAICLRPVIVELVPAAGETPYGDALSMIAVAGASFLILYTITSAFVTGQFNVSFPKLLDNLGTGVLGFVAGLLVWGFVTILLFTTPLSKSVFLKEVGFHEGLAQTNASYVGWWSNAVDLVASSGSRDRTVKQLIEDMLTSEEEEELPEEAEGESGT